MLLQQFWPQYKITNILKNIQKCQKQPLTISEEQRLTSKERDRDRMKERISEFSVAGKGYWLKACKTNNKMAASQHCKTAVAKQQWMQHQNIFLLSND